MYALAAAALLWVFHDVHPRRLLQTMTIAHWGFVLLAVAVDILTYVLQGVRWKLLLAPVGRIRSLRATQAIYAGLFTNEITPLRFGELVRAFLAARDLRAGIGAVVPSMLVERFLDALWLALGIGLAAILVPLPHNLLEAGDVLGGIVLAATAIFAWIVFRKEQELERGAEQSRRAGRLSAFVRPLARGLREIGLARRFYAAALLSGAMIACQGLAVWFMMLACGIRLHVGAGAVVFLVVRLGTAIPNAPANVGSFQFFTVLGLGLFGVDKTVAAGFSVVDFVALTAPLWGLGLVAISRTGMTLAEIREHVGRLARLRDRGAAQPAS
jgi:uncharacterized protein (TIRG00374 family)